jgi:hypothetical protein
MGAGGAVAVRLHTHQRGLVIRFLARIAEGVAHGLSQPLAKSEQAGEGGGLHGEKGAGSSSVLQPAAQRNR